MGDGPISNVTWLLENIGAVVARTDLGAAELDGLSRWSDLLGHPCVMLASGDATACRSRFDAAHELGHLILHRAVTPAQSRDPAIHRQLEQQAHRFAGAFLLPKAAFAAELFSMTLDSFRQLK